ncbi:flagellar assembly peptidoglycan hydrolase FlgJ [Aestuariirhabdus sp. LZHN29]|uniref:flagellar assembly peptidoglycan hydrolase FlgJ n=1 Tax=Aestuariirhabdus sp. LZHN29 TaxID=3417462 RepID=UPI003CF983C7
MSGSDLSLTHPGVGASASAQVYTDLNSLQNLKYASAEESPEALRKVAQQFESLFISMMLKSMRDANAVFEEDNPFSSSESRMYRDMLDSQMSVSLAESGGMGLAEVLMRQLDRSSNGNGGGAGRDRFIHQPQNQAADALARSMMEKAGIKQGAGAEQVPGSGANSVSDTRSVAAKADERIDSPLAFIRKMMPYAREVASKLGVEPKILVAQSALETGWGQKMIQREDGSNSFNLFGIKADSRWSGDSARVTTTEYRQGVALKEQADFRSYDSFAKSFDDYFAFLQQNERYQVALDHGGDAGQFLNGLQQAGYATDPAYADKILNIASNELFDDWQ